MLFEETFEWKKLQCYDPSASMNFLKDADTGFYAPLKMAFHNKKLSKAIFNLFIADNFSLVLIPGWTLPLKSSAMVSLAIFTQSWHISSCVYGDSAE